MANLLLLYLTILTQMESMETSREVSFERVLLPVPRALSLTREHSHFLTGASPEDDEDGKRGGKKTSEKRKAQNRQAQRNFRERKEKHLKDLEDKVGALEQRANDTESENSALKQLLQQ